MYKEIKTEKKNTNSISIIKRTANPDLQKQIEQEAYLHKKETLLAGD